MDRMGSIIDLRYCWFCINDDSDVDYCLGELRKHGKSGKRD
jgi:hypothetical protein